MSSKTSTHIRIEGDSVKEISETLMSEVKIEDFLDSIKMDIPINSGILSRGTIFFYKHPVPEGTSSLFVIEQSPKCISIRYKPSPRTGQGEEMKLRLSLPFVGVVIKVTNDFIKDGYVFCHKKRIESLDHPIHILPLPNSYDQGSGRICHGDSKVDNKTPMHEQIALLIKNFFCSQFNNDLTPTLPEELILREDVPERHNSMKYALEKWAEMTKKNSLVGITNEIMYPQHTNLTLKGLLSRLGYKEDDL